MADTKEAIEAVGATLTHLLKTGPTSPKHVASIKALISDAASSIAPSAEEATAAYERISREFLDNVIQVRGMPTRTILGGDGNNSGLVSSSGNHIAQKFDALLPAITDRFAWCVQNYSSQAQIYRTEQFAVFQALLSAFLKAVPAGGTKDKDIKSQITGIKKELRYFAKWDRQFFTYKARSFSAEVEYIVTLENNPLAAIWHYSPLDEQGEYKKTYSHKRRNNRVYAVRGNWALEKGLMKADACGYIDEITRPGHEVGCMCYLQWIYHVGALPADMQTAHGRTELSRARRLLERTDILPPEVPSLAPAAAPGPMSRLKRWFGGR